MDRNRLQRWLSVTLLLILAPAISAIQSPTSGPAVELFVTVMDAQKQFVKHLGTEDFEIYDRGVGQPITAVDGNPRPIHVVLLLDTSGSMRDTIDAAAGAAAEFFRLLGPSDAGLLGAFSDKVSFYPSTGFTSDVSLLGSALKQIKLGYPTGLYDALGQSIERLKQVSGRRVIVVFTDGEDNISKSSAKDITSRARDADVTVWSIGVINEYFDGQHRVRTSPDRGLKRLSADSGGGFSLLRDVREWAPAFQAVAEEIHAQYVVAFTPAVRDGKIHKLDVKVRNPGLTVRSRQSYQSGSAR